MGPWCSDLCDLCNLLRLQMGIGQDTRRVMWMMNSGSSPQSQPSKVCAKEASDFGGGRAGTAAVFGESGSCVVGVRRNCARGPDCVCVCLYTSGWMGCRASAKGMEREWKGNEKGREMQMQMGWR